MSSIHPMGPTLRSHSIRARLSLRIAILPVAALLAVPASLAAQAPQGTPATQATAPGKSHPRSKPSPARATVPQEQPPADPPAPEPPHWPANDTPAKPTITWDSQGLKIDAANASLHDILNDVSAATGTKVEGFAADERVFGEYGPGEARDVLSQLLHGSGYNVLMIGDQGSGTPRQIVLSARKAGGNNNTAVNNRAPQDMQDEDVPDQPEVDDQPPPQPQLINGRPPMQPQGPPGGPRTPQQILQELQQRQQQMQEQQMQQQQQQPPQQH